MAKELKIGMEGREVGELQKLLKLLGQKITDKSGAFGASTTKAVKAFQRDHNLKVDGISGALTSKEMAVAIRTKLSEAEIVTNEKPTVSGRVQFVSGEAVAGINVQVLYVVLGEKEKRIGQATTDTSGQYQINYDADKLGEPLNIIVRVVKKGRKMPAAQSPVIFKVKEVTRVNLTIKEERSEFRRTIGKIETAIDGSKTGKSIDALTSEHIEFIAAETGVNPKTIHRAANSHRLAKELEWPEEITYALLSSGIVSSKVDLLRLSADQLKNINDQAVKDGIISKDASAKFDKALVELHGKQGQILLSETNGKPSFADALLDIADLSKKEKSQFAQRIFEYGKEQPDDGSERREFWAWLKEKSSISKSKIEKIQTILSLSTITQNHIPLIKKLFVNHAASEHKDLRYLAAYDLDKWKAFVSSKGGTKGVGVPENFKPLKKSRVKASKENQYSLALQQGVALTSPTASFLYDLKSSETNFKFKNEIIELIDKNPGFDLGATNIDSFLGDENITLPGNVQTNEAKISFVFQLKRWQRVYRFAPELNRFDVMRALINDNIDSSMAVQRMGKSAYIRKYGKYFGSQDERKELAEKSFQDARRISEKTTAVMGLLQDLVGNVSIYALDGGQGLDENNRAILDNKIPTWKTLFGSQDFCACEHCRSVYSPAAYLVDVLNFLSYRGENNGQTPLDILKSRRGDITELKLSCDNTNKLIPYVDLVNEILENSVDSSATNLDSTSGTEVEFASNPTNLNEKAYIKLSNAIFPLDLPLDIWLEEARIYLRHLKTSRHEIMKTCKGLIDLSVADKEAIAYERIGCSDLDIKLILGDSGAEYWELWGLDENGNQVPDPDNPGQHLNLLWAEALSRVSVFLKRSAYTFEALQKLLKTRYVNPNENIEIEFHGNSCDLDRATIINATPDDWKKISRFIRLQKKLGWDIMDIDKAIHAFSKVINKEFLLALSHIDWLKDKLDISVLNLLSWWGAIDTFSYQLPGKDPISSLYENIFQNKTVLNPPDEIFNLEGDRSELIVPTELITNNSESIMSALNINAEDLAFLINAKELALLADDDLDAVVDKLDLKNISSMYRIVSLSNALDISIREYLSLRALTGINPYQASETENSLLFVKAVHKIKNSAFSIQELDYLLRHVDVSDHHVAPTGDAIDQVLVDIRNQLLSNQPQDQPQQKMSVRQLIESELDLDAENAEFLLGTLTRNFGTGTKPGIDDFIMLGKSGLKATYFDETDLTGNIVDGARTDADINFSSEPLWALDFPNNNPKKDEFSVRWEGQLLPKTTGGYDFHTKIKGGVRLWIDGVLIIDQWGALSEQEYSSRDLSGEYINLDGGRVYAFKLEYQSLSEDPYMTLSWSSDSNIDKEIIPSDSLIPNQDIFVSARKQYVRVFKIGMLLNKFGMTRDESAYLEEHGSDFSGIDFNDLPVVARVYDNKLYSQWALLADLFGFRDAFPERDTKLIDIFGAATSSGDAAARLVVAKNNLQAFTNWKESDINTLISDYGLVVDGLKNEKMLVRAAKCLALGKRLGVSIENLHRWAIAAEASEAVSDISDTNFIKKRNYSQSIKSVAKAKYDNEAWLEVAQPLRDVLREKQRVALVSYLIQEKNIESANHLYAYFLVDVEMSPCRMTSRIKQANSSVQLFVQRCLMNLEKEVVLEDPDAWNHEWKVMKNYRVWEANRKVFLYPENWIEPELRDNKSPIFKDLENELLQNEITTETAEKAYVHYLERLDEVARLEIVGMYHEQGTAADLGTLHVFGRTRGIPNIYFYRKRIKLENTFYWTAWEKVDLDIEGDHLIPVIYNRRLYLFWPKFEFKAIEEVPEEGGAALPRRYVEIQMAFSEYQYDKWSPKKVSEEVWTYDFDSKPQSISGSRKLLFPQTDDHDIEHTRTAYGSVTAHHFEQILPVNFTFTYTTNESGIAIDVLISNRRIYASGEQIRKLYKSSIQEAVDADRDRIAAGLHRHPQVRHADHLVFNPGAYNSGWLEDRKMPGFQLYGCDRNLKLRPSTAHTFQPKKISGTKLDNMMYQATSVSLWGPGNEWLLKTTPGIYRLTSPGHFQNPLAAAAFHDDERTFVYGPEKKWVENPGGLKVGDFKLPPEVIEMIKILVSEGFVGELPIAVDGPGDPVPFESVSGISMRGSPSRLRSAHETDFAMVSAYESGALSGYAEDLDTYNVTGVAPLYSSSAGGMMEWSGNIAVAESPVGEVVYVPPHMVEKAGYVFREHYHPFVCDFVKELIRYGVEGLLKPKNDQLVLQELNNGITFNRNVGSIYRPRKYIPYTNEVMSPYPVEDIDFDSIGAYSLYNWELFFHIPFMIAVRLSNDQKFEKAQQWFHYIFDPTYVPDDSAAEPVPSRFWRVRPFFENGQPMRIQELMKLLGLDDSSPLSPALSEKLQNLEAQIEQWRKHPFMPHVIARLRTPAYQKAVVKKYIDNLIAWGDQLFRRYSIESLTEATQLYILAAEILGKRPEKVTRDSLAAEDESFTSLQAKGLDSFSNVLGEIESAINVVDFDGSGEIESDELVFLPNLHFCIPKNDKLMEYWDTVEDRLFKIRHCQDIEGVERKLPLFEPPIDPGMLVRAAAAGVDIGSVLSGMFAPLPHYRFNVMFQKAVDLTNDVKALGLALLSALEKKDAEEISQLRSGHEIQILNAVKDVRKQQINEAKESLKGLEATYKTTEVRLNYYVSIKKISSNEQLHMDLLSSAQTMSQVASGIGVAASIAHLIPNFDIGVEGWAASPVTKAAFGGSQVGSAVQAAGQVISMIASQMSHDANMASVIGSHDRRWVDWKLQEKLAGKELVQIDKQIEAAKLRVMITEKELSNHIKQIDNAREANDFLRDKYTNKELYSWMVSQISSVYFQSYQLAYDVAKQAEKCFQHEIGDSATSFVQFGYWDSLKKGLMVGEKLNFDLKRMDAAYLQKNKRNHELTKNISLSQINPFALLNLKEKGSCEFVVPEVLFDLDHPGHYFRRIKSVGLTIPCVVGPYTNVSCKLTLIKNRVRAVAITSPDYKYQGADDTRFVHDWASTKQSIATSNGQNDRGMFEFNFRDERYLPFEGSGAISEWRLELPDEFRQFDYDSISDVVLQMQFTAEEGGEELKTAVKTDLKDSMNMLTDWLVESETGLSRSISAVSELGTEWHRFISPPANADSQVMELKLEKRFFPYVFNNKTLKINKITVVLMLEDASVYGGGIPVTIDPDGLAKEPLVSDDKLSGQPYREVSPNFDLENSPLNIAVTIDESDLAGADPSLVVVRDGKKRLNSQMVKDLIFFIDYTIKNG